MGIWTEAETSVECHQVRRGGIVNLIVAFGGTEMAPQLGSKAISSTLRRPDQHGVSTVHVSKVASNGRGSKAIVAQGMRAVVRDLARNCDIEKFSVRMFNGTQPL